MVDQVSLFNRLAYAKKIELLHKQGTLLATLPWVCRSYELYMLNNMYVEVVNSNGRVADIRIVEDTSRLEDYVPAGWQG
ncbi:hypothetical protein V6R21_03345 [Limibacter armeniacum]|uniref:hypothetical protein n=1 Tax=Limibacter armeniacum TaxID=466084 RepID=UPI002FE6437C